MNSLILGIDTGGTHTDAVVYNPRTKMVVAYAKSATTHYDLSHGISKVLGKLMARNWAGGREAIRQINLSTTLATNSIAEGLSSQVGLIMMGYDADQAAVRHLVQKLPLVEPVFVSGSHNFYGQEEEPLDEKTVAEAAQRLDPKVAAWAVSGFFSVKNPSHEIAAARVIKEFSNKPVTMGRDLTGEYDAIRRAATAALNAGLVAVINRLLNSVKKSAEEFGLEARMMVVKGDGSLVSEDWAREKPIETVVSGPAASLVGAEILGRGFMSAGESSLWVMDIGGTTTDLALVHDGRPVVNPNGAKVGAWHTMTTAVETRTRGLGGDSSVEIGKNKQATLGPRRVLPLCRLAEKYPDVVQTLKTQYSLGLPATVAWHFFMPGSPPDSGLTADERLILKALDQKTPLSLAKYAEDCFESGQRFGGLRNLKHPAIMISAFTPTDAMAIKGLYSTEAIEASLMGAKMLGRSLSLTPEEVAALVLDEFGRLLTEEIVRYGFDRDEVDYRDHDFGETGIFTGPLRRKTPRNIRVKLEVEDPIVLLGAPAAVLAPFLGRHVKARIVVPQVFDAASAVGAAVAPIQLSRKIEIHSLPNFIGFRLFLPDEIIDGESVDELAALADCRMTAYMKTLAAVAGADSTSVSSVREDRIVKMGEGSVLNLGASICFSITET